MTFDPNDPRLTAYVLGELDPSERPTIEAMLETSPEGRQAVEEIRRTIGWLTEHLREEQAAPRRRAESNHRPLTVVSLPSARALPGPGGEAAASRLAGVAALLLLATVTGSVGRPRKAAASPSAMQQLIELADLAEGERRMRTAVEMKSDRPRPLRPRLYGTGPRTRYHRVGRGRWSWRSSSVYDEPAAGDGRGEHRRVDPPWPEHALRSIS